jgi:carboxypeptidase family protein
MRRQLLVVFAVCLLVSAVPGADERAAGNTGTIKGLVRLSGKPPGNVVIHMGMDPMCAKMYAGKRPVDEVVVVTSAAGGLANVFVKLEGSFPSAPVPTQPVVVDQRGCFYVPRMLGARVGQVLRIKNSDNLLHNVHSQTTKSNMFNVAQPISGMQYDIRLKDEEILQLKCDVHRWMTAFVGVVNHPYFAVSDLTGAFEINNVPAGTYTIQAWHERYGPVRQTVRVGPGAATAVNFAYTGTEKPSTGP